ncbi:uncharacterized protein LOC113212804 [Frankliniella occidentalis]|uniref:Uncharacterized protein LOC113212804 n=1 Tax=Frankliniella occidentalis TaxID=133901 RepID=A0A9C6XA28_FRAOC|nr:uncharacterized protein LOC113212804 [Frankliniella occidentalis]
MKTVQEILLFCFLCKTFKIVNEKHTTPFVFLEIVVVFACRFSTTSSLLLTAGVVGTNVYLGARLAYDWLPASWGFIMGGVLLGLGYLAHIVYLLLDMASSCGASNKLATCRFGQRFLNQPCPR